MVKEEGCEKEGVGGMRKRAKRRGERRGKRRRKQGKRKKNKSARSLAFSQMTLMTLLR